MKTKIAMVFPGQGSQSVGMLAEMAQAYPIIQETFESASQVLNYDLWQLVQENPDDQLNQTEFTQPALLAADVAMWRCWQQEQGFTPSVLAGHSLGEYAALVCAKAIPFEQAIDLVAKRGRYMQQAVGEGEGAMAAIIGLDDAAVQTVCEEASQGEVITPANFNSIGQTVVAGQVAAVKRAVDIAKQNGAKLAKLIPVSVPSHCALMQSAAEKLAQDLNKADIIAPTIPIIHNVDVAEHADPQQIRTALIEQLVSPVRWVETVQRIIDAGVNDMVECGPGKVLSGLNKRITRDVPTHNIDAPQKLIDTIGQIKENVSCH